MFKRIISVLLVIAISSSLLVMPASAADGVGGNVQNFIEWSVSSVENLTNSFWKIVFGDDWRSADQEQLSSALSNYNSRVNTAFGGGSFSGGSGGRRRVRYYVPILNTIITNPSYVTISSFNQQVGSTNASAHASFSKYTGELRTDFETLVTAPFTAKWSSHHFSGGTAYASDSTYSVVWTGAERSGTVQSGDSVNLGLQYVRFLVPRQKTGGSSYQYFYDIFYSYLAFMYVDFEPVSDDFWDENSTGLNLTINSRVGSLVGDYYFENSNGNWVAESIQVVNEGDNIFYNPYTDQSTNFDSFTYDYAEREYNLYAQDGSQIGKVVYGDEYVTIEEGGNTYNFYYYLGSGGSDEPPEETRDFYEWWKNAWSNFTERLFAVLRPSGGSVADDDTLTENTPPQTDDEGNEWSLGDLTKAALQGVWKIGSGIVKVTVGGVTYLVETITDAGDFFTPYNDSSADTGIYSMFNEEGGAA